MSSHKPGKPVSLRGNVCRLAIVAALFALTFTSAAQAQSFTVLHSFTGAGDGSAPTGLTIDQSGNIYGASIDYPNPGAGLVFKMTNRNSGWTLVPLWNFGIPTGAGEFPNGVVIGPDGKLYGTTIDGGPGGAGTVFRLSPPASICRTVLCPWTETDLADFAASAYPENADLAFDQAGNIYGTTPFGGDYFNNCPELGCGIVYELSPVQGGYSQSFYPFEIDTGYTPFGGVVVDNAGNLYGTVSEGGSAGCGTVFELTPMNGGGWSENTLFTFDCGTSGALPVGTLLRDSSGNLYGSTTRGGAGGGGTVFELTPAGGSWTFNLVYSFSGSNGGPGYAVTTDAAGNLYGATSNGAHGFGNVFKLTPNHGSWIYTSLYDFTGGSDGAYPSSKILMDSQGNLYGSTAFGGIQNSTCTRGGCGVVFKITP